MRWKAALTMNQVREAINAGLRVERTLYVGDSIDLPPSNQPGSKGWLLVNPVELGKIPAYARFRIGEPSPEHYGEW